jgi:hypothetical protein
MTPFEERVTAALDVASAQEAGIRIHEVVANEVRSLDPAAKVELTGYFNHSYVPDLVVTWGGGRQPETRPVFLRHSLRSSRAAGDLTSYERKDKSTLYLSLDREEPAEEAILVGVANRHPESRVLVTTVPAISELSQASDQPDPVLGLVRASVIRSAKGAFVESAAERLVLPRERRIESGDLQAFTETVATSFTEDAVVRINRVFRIVEQALAATPDASLVESTGSLSETEIRELVPYLLGLPEVTQDKAFWSAIARLIDLGQIESMWDALSALDLSPLAAAASSLWTASRVRGAPRAEAIGVDDFDRTPRWSVYKNLLCAEVGDWQLVFASHASRMKRDPDRGLASAHWDDLRTNLTPYKVIGVDLRGVVARSTYEAQDAVDMKDRISAFIENEDDSFFVPSVTILTGSGESTSEVVADFTEMMLRASPESELATLTKVALDVLGYRHSTPREDVAALLGTDGGLPAV